MSQQTRPARCGHGWPRVIAAGILLAVPATGLHAATPQIRTSPRNTVPACVTPDRLMAFLKQRNRRLSPRFERIADDYRRHGETWNVRWDYAFFQMALETNFLTYRRGNGAWGDVNPKQNNFAGLGTTGGGVPGDSYPDVSTGVLAQIQHLVVYSGQRLANPVGHRTRLKQDAILASTAQFKGQTTFADLARRWAADKRYGQSIEWVASRYRKIYCTGRRADAASREPRQAARLGGPASLPRVDASSPVRTVWSRNNPQLALNAQAPAARPRGMVDAQPAPAPVLPQRATREGRPEQPTAVAATQNVVVPAPVDMQEPDKASTPRPQLKGPVAFTFGVALAATRDSEATVRHAAATDGRCRIMAASYGGTKTLLVRAHVQDEIRYTALTVLDGFESSMLQGYVKVHAPGGESLGSFDSKDAALAKARALCPGEKAASQTNRTRAG
jgi:hypothetical protein